MSAARETTSSDAADGLAAELATLVSRLKQKVGEIRDLQSHLAVAQSTRTDLARQLEDIVRQCETAGINTDAARDPDLLSDIGNLPTHVPAPATVLSWSAGTPMEAAPPATTNGHAAPPPTSGFSKPPGLLPPSGIIDATAVPSEWSTTSSNAGHDVGSIASLPSLSTVAGLTSLPSVSGASTPSYPLPVQATAVAASSSRLKLGVWNRVSVCHLESGLFWLHEDEQSEKLADVEMQMLDMYESTGDSAMVKPGQVNVGNWFGAMYDADEAWTRSIVLSKSDDGETVTIMHADYGSTATVKISELRLLKAEFLELPAQAIMCELNGTAHYMRGDKETSTHFIKVMSEFVDYNSYFCSVVRDPGATRRPWVVNMFNEAGNDIFLSVQDRMTKFGIERAALQHAVANPPPTQAPPDAPKSSVLTPTAKPFTPPSVNKVGTPKPQAPKAETDKTKLKKKDPQQGAWGKPPPPSQPESKLAEQQGTDEWVEVKKPPPKPAKESVAPTAPTPAGFVFHCSSVTATECLERQLFGLPKKFADSMASSIKPAIDNEPAPSPLFLFNIQKNLMYGPFVAVSECGLDLEPDAWKTAMKRHGGRGSPFPAQVRVRWSGDETEPVKMGSRINIGPVNPKTTATFLAKLQG
eukprot:m.164885 g.164885  ORF g.164885 m.164885 type:complete len:639 (-) comp12485_c0_seq1:59-1975(-)